MLTKGTCRGAPLSRGLLSGAAWGEHVACPAEGVFVQNPSLGWRAIFLLLLSPFKPKRRYLKKKKNLVKRMFHLHD